MRLLRSRRADGVIIAAAAIRDRNIDRLAMSGYPVAFLGQYPQDPELCAVGVDDRAAPKAPPATS